MWRRHQESEIHCFVQIINPTIELDFHPLTLFDKLMQPFSSERKSLCYSAMECGPKLIGSDCQNGVSVYGTLLSQRPSLGSPALRANSRVLLGINAAELSTFPELSLLPTFRFNETIYIARTEQI
jgi:hypothetical protein